MKQFLGAITGQSSLFTISVETAFGLGMAMFVGTFFTMLLAVGIIIGFKPSLMILIISVIVCLASAGDSKG